MASEAMTNKHGGPGRGQGRKPLDGKGATKVAVTLLPEQVKAMKQLGNGNLSAGIRKAIEMTTQTTNVTLKFVAQSGHVWEETVDADEVDQLVERTVATHGDIERVEQLASPDDISGDTIWKFE